MSTDSIVGGTGTTEVLALGAPETGTIEFAGDQDWYKVTLSARHYYQFDLQSYDPSALGVGLGDPFLVVLNASGNALAVEDDYAFGADSRITFYSATNAIYYVSAGGASGSAGDFRLTATDLGYSIDLAGSTATPGSVSVGGSASGILGHGGDQDWYAVTLVAGHQYRFGLHGLDSGSGTLSDPLLRLRSGTGALLSSDDDSGLGLESRIAFTAGQSGTYYLSAQGADLDGGSFVLDVEDVTSGGAGDVAGGTSSLAALAVGGSVSSAIDAGGDQDWYRVTLQAGHDYRFDLHGFGTGQNTLDDPVLRLLSGSGGLIELNDDAAASLDSSITFSAGAGGTYFLSAQGFGSASGTFTLEATDLGAGAVDAVPGGIGTGASVAVGGAVTGLIDGSADQDWFQVTLEVGEQYRFDLRGASAGTGTLVDPVLRLLDASGVQIALNDDGAGTLDSTLTYTATGSGTYFLSAQGFGAGAGTYELAVSDVAQADESDGPDDAIDIVPGSTDGRIETGDDQDWYRIDLEGGHDYRFDLLALDSAVGTLDDPFLMLFDNGGEIVSTDDDGGAGLESRIEFTPANDGTYFLVTAGLGTSTGSFRLDATDLGASTDAVPGDTSSAFSVAINESVTGLIDTGSDQDWYQVTLVQGELYRFDLLGVGSGQGTLDDPVLDLRDDTGNPITSNDDRDFSAGLLESRIEYTADRSGTYYLAARGFDLNPGSYRLDAINLSNPLDVPASIATAGQVTVDGAALLGVIDVAGDQDWYRLALDAGHAYRLDLNAQNAPPGALADPYLRLLDSEGAQELVNDDRDQFTLDSRIEFSVNFGDTFYVSAEGFGTATGTYSVAISEIDVPGSLASYTSVVMDTAVTGSIGASYDVDWYHVALTAGEEYRFDLTGSSSGGGTLLDPLLYLYDGTGVQQLAVSDDANGTLDSSITYTASGTGDYFLSAESFGSGTGTFTLTATATGGDTFDGTAGDDDLVGGGLDDVLSGDDGDDLLDGKEGDDILDGGAGADRLAGGAGDDLAFGGDGGDIFVQANLESLGDDLLFGEGGDDEFHDAFGHNLLDGGDGDDFFSVFSADDGSNLATGGAGRDTWQPLAGMTEAAGLAYLVSDFTTGAGGDLLDVSRLLQASADAGYLDPGESTAGFLRLIGSGFDTLLQWNLDGAGDDWVTQLDLKNTEVGKVESGNFVGAQAVGSKGADALSGALGDDTLVSAGGNDTLIGGAGADVLVGGSGGDTYYVDDDKDVVVETSNTLPSALVIGGGAHAGPGDLPDTVTATVNFSLANAPFVENITLAGTATAATGNALANVMRGNALSNTLTGAGGNDTLAGAGGHDTLDGGTGNDSMAGGAGNDVYTVGAAGDQAVELATGGTDTVRASVSETLDANVENLLLTGGTGLSGTGNASANTLTGNGGNNLLDGKGGGDTLKGMGGNDILAWSSLDTYDGGTGTDTLKVLSGSLDLTTLANTRIKGIEQIDLTGGGNNRLTLGRSDVLALSSTTDTLKVLGDAGDRVIAAGFTQLADQGAFHRYQSGTATLLIETDVTVTL